MSFYSLAFAEQMMKLSKDEDEPMIGNSLNGDEENRLDLDQLQVEAGPLVEALAEVTAYLRSVNLTAHEYVLLKVLLLTELPDQPLLGIIYQTHLGAMAAITGRRYRRFQRLLKALAAVQQAAELLIQSKMFYVPYLLTASVSPLNGQPNNGNGRS